MAKPAPKKCNFLLEITETSWLPINDFCAHYCKNIAPLNRGHIRNIVIQLTPPNWPIEVSKKNSGIPHKKSIST